MLILTFNFFFKKKKSNSFLVAQILGLLGKDIDIFVDLYFERHIRKLQIKKSWAV